LVVGGGFFTRCVQFLCGGAVNRAGNGTGTALERQRAVDHTFENVCGPHWQTSGAPQRKTQNNAARNNECHLTIIKMTLKPIFVVRRVLKSTILNSKQTNTIKR
jgi:hypothetical protein